MRLLRVSGVMKWPRRFVSTLASNLGTALCFGPRPALIAPKDGQVHTGRRGAGRAASARWRGIQGFSWDWVVEKRLLAYLQIE